MFLYKVMLYITQELYSGLVCLASKPPIQEADVERLAIVTEYTCPVSRYIKLCQSKISDPT